MSASADVAVEITRTMLQQDGYDVQLVGFDAGELQLAIVAGPNACEDCLVPKPLCELRRLLFAEGGFTREFFGPFERREGPVVPDSL